MEIEIKTKKKRGYLSNFVNYRDWYNSHNMLWQREHMVRCQHCGKKFKPNSPNQKFCGEEDNPSCYKARNNSEMANGGWVRNYASCYLTTVRQKLGQV